MRPLWKLWMGGNETSADPVLDWRGRIAALRNVPPLLRMVWQASSRHLVWSVGLRMAGALIPVTTLWISKLIIDRVVRAASADRTLNVHEIWYLVGLLFLLSMLLHPILNIFHTRRSSASP